MFKTQRSMNRPSQFGDLRAHQSNELEELRRQNNELRAKYESQKVFTCMIMHDIRHPIEALISMIQSTKRDLADANGQLEKRKFLLKKLRKLLETSSFSGVPQNFAQSPRFGLSAGRGSPQMDGRVFSRGFGSQMSFNPR